MQQFLLVLAVAVVLMTIVLIGLCTNILFRKNGRFPVTSIGRNREMKKRGITCVKHDEIACHGKGSRRGSCCS